MRSIPSICAAIAIGTLSFLLGSCSSERLPFAGFNERPTVELTAAPAPFDSVHYQVRFAWKATDPVGEVVYFLYAVDPSSDGDTTWVRTEKTEVTLFFTSSTPPDPLPIGAEVISHDFHVFVLEAVDNGGLPSAPAYRAFTSQTVAPQTQITEPAPSRLKEAIVAPDFHAEWEGVDPDGVTTDRPLYYKYRMVSEFEIQDELVLGQTKPRSSDLQRYFSIDAPVFAGWDSVPPDSTTAAIHARTPGMRHFLAVVAFDEAGAYEPRFLLDNNLLQFLPSTHSQPPRITIYNSFFSRTQLAGGFDLDPREIFRLEMPCDLPIGFHWYADPGAPGTQVEEFRWVLDPIDGDIWDETPREDENDVHHWSEWSDEESITLPPFPCSLSDDALHRFYLQARDNVGAISMVVVEIRVIVSTLSRPLLIFDDFRAEPDRLVGGRIQPSGAFPGESILDTLLYAVGGVPWQEEPFGRTMTEPGVFAGFEYDTLDYRFFPFEGLPLSVMGNYQALVWYIAPEDAGRRGGKFTSSDPMAALRFINTMGQTNTLAVYLENGGKTWLFGGGVVPAIANGYVSRFGVPFARYPLTGEGDGPSQTSILWPGNFLYDYLHVRSTIELNTRDFFPTPKEVVDLIPYLPKHRTPGAPWPPIPGETPPRGAMDDPRIGPAAERNLDPVASAGGWGIPAIPQDLPMLTITTEWPDYPRPLPGSIDEVFYIAERLDVLEDHDGDPATPQVSRMDTLYLIRAVEEVISDSPTNPDGKPVFVYYWGEEHGPVAWSSVDLWYFERTQLRVLAEIILDKFGLYKNPNPREWTGPGSAHATAPGVISTR